MITKNDCLLLLTELQDEGIEVNKYINNLYSSTSIPLEIIKFINDHRKLELTNFYEKLRKSYNNKKSNLYINIVKEIEDPIEVIITLASLNLQILLFSKQVEDKKLFLQSARYQEILKVLEIYYQKFDSTSAIKLLKLIKADLKCLEYIKN